MNLTEAAYYSRNAIKYSILFLLFLVASRLLWEVGFGVYRRFVPPEPPAPQVAWGKLSSLPFSDKKDSSGLNFTLQTPTGELPKFSTIANVYFMPQKTSSFLDLDEATRIANNLGFTKNPQKISETIYRFDHKDLPSNLDINIVNKTFSVSYNLAADPELLNSRPRSTEEAQRAVTSFLSQAKLLPPDLENGQKTFDFLKPDPPNFSPALSLSEASFVRVNLFRAPYNDIPVLTPSAEGSNIWFLVAADRFGSSKVIAGEYHYFGVEEEQVSTYPIKTGQQAWEELKGGRGFIISPALSGKTDITIRRINLAYYDSGEPQGFLQPIVVFEGDDNFVAYLPAVTDEFYGD